ncbi:MAG: DNA-methyltransferase [Treponema sp.]
MSFSYIDVIIKKSLSYLKLEFSSSFLQELLAEVEDLRKETDVQKVITSWIHIYIDAIKRQYQKQDELHDKRIFQFIEDCNVKTKIIWGDALKVLKKMKSESIHLMVTSPPYYNARDYSHWNNLDEYLLDMRHIIREAYRVLDNHRVFVWNVGDIFDNDNLFTTSVWGKRRIPLGAYFIKIFEEEGFTFVDDYIWDKGEVQSERQKNGEKPYPFYQYPANCYEHILIFHKHRRDDTRFPCPVCGCLKVNGNAFSEIGLRSWECKNTECFKRSAANRGKRFSLKTLITQERQGDEFKIEEDFIKKYRRDIVKFSPVIKINSKGQNTLGHTAPFPFDIPDMAIRFFSYAGEKVLDPFGGSMTSVISAYKNNRIGIGIELNKARFRMSILQNLKKHLEKNIEIAEIDDE